MLTLPIKNIYHEQVIVLLLLTRLTHWGQDKMAVDFPDDTFKCIFLNDNNINFD